MNHNLQYRTAAGIVCRQGYPREPDPPEPETELVFSHADLRPEDDCCGDFRAFKGRFECDKCGMLMTKEELISLAAEVYENWEEVCTSKVLG